MTTAARTTAQRARGRRLPPRRRDGAGARRSPRREVAARQPRADRVDRPRSTSTSNAPTASSSTASSADGRRARTRRNRRTRCARVRHRARAVASRASSDYVVASETQMGVVQLPRAARRAARGRARRRDRHRDSPTPTQPGYAQILREGATFTWESWDARQTGDSESHGWGATVLAVLQDDVLGVRVDRARRGASRRSPYPRRRSPAPRESSRPNAAPSRSRGRETSTPASETIDVTVPANASATVHLAGSSLARSQRGRAERGRRPRRDGRPRRAPRVVHDGRLGPLRASRTRRPTGARADAAAGRRRPRGVSSRRGRAAVAATPLPRRPASVRRAARPCRASDDTVRCRVAQPTSGKITAMRFSYAETFCDPTFLAPLAQAAEAAGYDSFVVPDSLIFPAESDTLYPYTADGDRAFLEDKPIIEPFTLIPYLAARTQHDPLHHVRAEARGPARRAGRQAGREHRGAERRPPAARRGHQPVARGLRGDGRAVGEAWQAHGRDGRRVARAHGAATGSSTTAKCCDLERCKICPVPEKPIPLLVGGPRRRRAPARRVRRATAGSTRAATRPSSATWSSG